jgi:hypothetical protein
MSLHISRFLDRVRAAESKHHRDVVMPLNEARDLHADITRLLLALEAASQTRPAAQPLGSIEVSGGDF